MDNLVLIIDNSYSMDQCVLNTGGLTRLEIVKKQLDDLLQVKDLYESIWIFTFEHTALFLGRFMELAEARKIISQITTEPVGITNIDYTVSRVIKNIESQKQNDSKAEHFTIICLTDGEDQSSYEREKLIKTYSDLGNMYLKIILICDSQKEIVEKPASNTTLEILKLHDINELKNSIIASRMIKTKKIKPFDDISIPIFPLVDCELNDLQKIRNEFKTVVPYLESLTGLRYYPVPTFIVNRFLLQEVGIAEKHLENHESDLISDLSELLEYTSAVELTFHTHGFTSLASHDEREDLSIEDYGSFINREAEYRQWVRWNAEAISVWLHNFINGEKIENPKPYSTSNENRILASPQECVSAIKEIQTTIKMVLQKLKEWPLNKIEVNPSYFVDPKRYIKQDVFLETAIRRNTPDLRRWKRLLNDAEYKNILKYVDHSERWKLDIESIFKVYSIALDTIYRLLPKARALSSVNSQVIKNRETYGIYLPPESGAYIKLDKILNDQKFPLFFNIDKSGVVLICIEDSKKDCDEIENNDLWPDFLSSILVHEHTHAITRQGVAKMEKDNFIEWQGDPQKSKIVNEALAEWAELNYCRDRKSLYQVTIEHASSGQLPEWPYAGALALEMEFQKKGEGFFKRLLKMYRSGNEKSYDRFF